MGPATEARAGQTTEECPVTDMGRLYTLKKRRSYLLKLGGTGTEIVKVQRDESLMVVEEQIEPDRWIEAYHHEYGFCKFIYGDWVPAGDDTYPEEE